jgi:hypothetical protein
MEQLLFSEKGKSVIVQTQKYKNEIELQEIIKKNPRLLNLSSIFKSSIMIIGRESLNIDVLGITIDGVPVVIECKRRDNPDMRYLIAQVFEYASKLEGLNYNDFDQIVINYLASERCDEEQYKNLNLLAAFQKFWETNAGSDEEDESFDGDKFVSNVSENLKNGEFFLVIVVDEISETASRTIEFLNRKLLKLRIEVIEISKFSDDNHSIYVPNHVNKEVKSGRGTQTQPGKTTFDEMIENAGAMESEYLMEFRSGWEDGGDFSIVMGTKGFSSRYLDIPVLYVLPTHFRITSRIKRQYQNLFDPMMELFEKHFYRDLKVGVSYNSQGFSTNKIRAFIMELKSLCKKSI